MQFTRKDSTDTKIILTITAEQADLDAAKERALKRLAPKVKVHGFRTGKVPPALAEKNIDPNYLQTEAIDDAVSVLYGEALAKEGVRPVAQPKIDLTKFVPYTNLEFTAEIEVLGKITLPNYKKIATIKPTDKVTAKDVDEVIQRILLQTAQYKEVDRAAQKGDRVYIDFDGKDSKGVAINGVKGENYPLTLGSNSFIPGFEGNLVGAKNGSEPEFTISFPADYGAKPLQGKKVTFNVKVNKIEETIKSNIDDELAKKVGPFKDVNELRLDIERQVGEERTNTAKKDFEDELVKTLAKNTKVSIPQVLLNEQVAKLGQEFKQSLTYRGETFTEYLENTQQTEQEYTQNELQPAAEERLKAGLALSEVAEKENITVTPQEIEIRVEVMKGQYASDKQMQEELAKPENHRDIANRLLTEKTIARLVTLNS